MRVEGSQVRGWVAPGLSWVTDRRSFARCAALHPHIVKGMRRRRMCERSQRDARHRTTRASIPG